MTVFSIILAILLFGILIVGHEAGHFMVAKACGIKVNEFAVGMGPAIWKKKKGETLYSIRCLPIGGYCAMEGEDEETPDPRAFTSQPAWKRFLVLVAGAAMNMLMGFLIVLILFSGEKSFVSSTVTELVDGFQYSENGLQEGDTILTIDGHRIYTSSDFSMFMSRSTDGKVDMVVRRDGKRVILKDYGLQPAEYADGYRYGLTFELVEANFWQVIRFSWNETMNFIRLVWISLGDLLRGAVGLKDMAGVVGVVDVIGQVGAQSGTVSNALWNIFYVGALVAVNLAVMNLLPIPALDGGRIFFLVITFLIEKLFHKKLNPKYEGYVHAAGMVLLLALMVVITFNDVLRIVQR